MFHADLNKICPLTKAPARLVLIAGCNYNVAGVDYITNISVRKLKKGTGLRYFQDTKSFDDNDTMKRRVCGLREIISKGEIISCGEYKVENVSHSTTTFSLSVSSEMAPGFRLMVLHTTADGEILTDSFFLPVDGFNKFNTELEVNTGKDHKAEKVEVRVSGGEGAFIGVQAIRASTFRLQAGNEMSLARVLQQFMLFENKTR